MIETSNVAVRKVYYQMSTNNKSFLDMHHFLKARNINNNRFFLVLLDPDLAGINPRDPRLNINMKNKVLAECIRNYWYFLREIVRIPDEGGAKNSGKKYELHRGNLAMNFCLFLNLNIFAELPRQQGKTAAIICRILWEYQFGTRNSESIFINKKYDDAKKNLERLKDYRDALPEYLRMSEAYDRDGKKIKARNTVEYVQHPTNGNRIKTLASARNRVSANGLGRGLTIPRIWYDEYAFIPYNKIIYLAATPAFKTASENARRNNAPYGIIITTTPGDLTTDEGLDAFQVKEDATKFSELWYDLTPDQIFNTINRNTSSSFVYIRYTYQQLGRDEEWFKSVVVDMRKNWDDIRREVLLEWSNASSNCPFTKQDLEVVKSLTREPIRQMMVQGYIFDVYKDMDLRYPPIIGVDVSGGYKRDSSAIVIIDSVTTEVCAVLNCNYISTTDLAKVLYTLVKNYMPNAIVNIERNGGFGASVLSKLVKTSIKKNLYYEIKDKIVEERIEQYGKMIKQTQRVKVYGLDSTKAVRDNLIEILRERMELHKDKFISPYIFNELQTLEVKRNGKVEHSDNGHDDTIFAYLMALYVWYDGVDVMERYGIQKKSLRTDQDLEEAYEDLETKYNNIIPDLNDNPLTEELDQTIDQLMKSKGKLYNEWEAEQEADNKRALERLLSTKVGRDAYCEKYHIDPKTLENGRYEIPDDVFNNFYN